MAKRLQEGDGVCKISATEWNRHVDVSDWYHNRRGRENEKTGALSPLATDFVKVRNDTGANRAAGEVVRLGPHLLTEVENDYPWFEGLLPNDAIASRYAVLLEPIPENEIGIAQVSGRVKALVDVGDTGHRFCTTADSDANLQSAASGPIELLSTPTGTGAGQALFVRLSVPNPFSAATGYDPTTTVPQIVMNTPDGLQFVTPDGYTEDTPQVLVSNGDGTYSWVATGDCDEEE